MDKVINRDLNVDIKIKPYVTINGYSLEEFMKKIDQLKNLLEEINQKVDDSDFVFQGNKITLDLNTGLLNVL
ncbi:hypothetical protein [uncultured Finegoldia sp.]|uniref:hypothetical protein n=1 Tax=uncultured Finegoldia sp. TaxID=328009 RepID=UPI0028053A39|nr:hypothetical protein [uncultured Finegoldia sp.]MDU1409816.1 hypothetical protein [Veillonella sp.]